jgi:hypothetical protein
MSILLYCCIQLVECFSRSLFLHFFLRPVIFAYYNDFPARSGIILTRDNLISRGCHYRSAKLEQNEKAPEDTALLPTLEGSRAYQGLRARRRVGIADARRAGRLRRLPCADGRAGEAKRTVW